jgi:hypothetical protein
VNQELLATIRALPLVEQVTLAEAILHGMADRLSKAPPARLHDDEVRRQEMRAAAQPAVEYYRTDADVALWRGLDAKP